jgi:hypothetical protein
VEFPITYKVFGIESTDPIIGGLPIGVVARHVIWSHARFAGRGSPETTATWFEFLTGIPGIGWVYAEWLDRFSILTSKTQAYDHAFWKECQQLSAHGGMFVLEEGELAEDDHTSISASTNAVFERMISPVPAVRRATYEVTWREFLKRSEPPHSVELSVDLEFPDGDAASLDFFCEDPKPVGGCVLSFETSRSELLGIRKALRVCQEQQLLNRATSVVLFASQTHLIPEEAAKLLAATAVMIDIDDPKGSQLLYEILHRGRY